MTAATPGQAAYEAHAGKMGGRRDAWGELPATYRDAWEAAAQAAIDAFLAGDSVSAESIREALAAHEQPAPGLAMLRADLADAEAQLAKWPRCPEGCGCRLATEDPFGRECGCDGPCGMECRENGYPDAPSYRDIPREDAQPAPELALGPCPFEGHDGEHLRLNTHGHWLCAVNLTNMLVAADVITDLHPERPAPGLFARVALAENQLDAQERVIGDYREEVTRLIANRDRLRELLNETGYDAALVALAALRDGIRELLDDVTASAGATRPSRKTEIEDEVAIALRKLLEG